jgi:transcriptional regulator with XRE-family HTH domain
MRGQFESGSDIAALRRFVRLSQPKFAEAMGISVHTLRNWEQDRRRPEGPALALLRIAARHPRILRENLESQHSDARITANKRAARTVSELQTADFEPLHS